MKNLISNLLVPIAIILSVSTIGCEKQKIPVVTTSEISNITATTAKSGGNITDEGNSTVTARGVCWSTNATPTISDSKTADGAGAGSFSSSLSDLFGGTTYFVRAYAANDAGTGYGMALSFKTTGQPPSAPTVNAQNASNVQTNSAQLNGIVNANFYSTVVTFEYGTSTSYGSTINATQSPIAGGTNTNISVTVSGLSVGTTYHFRIKAVNSLGTSLSDDIIFTTLGLAPDATTQTPTNLSTTSATLNGTVNAHDLSTAVTFEYGTTTSYGQSITATQSPVTGNTSKPVSAALSGLAPKTTYHCRVKTVNAVGTKYGNDVSFTTAGDLPTATTQIPTNILTTSAVLIGNVNANSLSTTVTFEYGTTISYGQSIPATQSPLSGSSSASVSANVLGLSIGTTYHYRVKAVNTLGTVYGTDVTFTTLGQIPSVVTQTASNIQPFSATLNGSVNANHLSSTVTFEYGETTDYGSTITAIQSPVIGATNTNITAPIIGLKEGTTYHFRVVAANSLGTSFGSDMTFLTLGQIPTVDVLEVSNMTSAGAQLNGTVNPNYLSTVITFEFGTTTSYGNTVTATQSPINNGTSVNVSAPITGLTVGTTYHFRIRAVNSLGTTVSSDMTLYYLYIGATFQGGKVFYIDGTGQHGLICAPTDQSTGIQWYNGNYMDTGATATDIGTGNANTNTIVSLQGTGSYAAKLCYDLILGSYSDWYLPSKTELSLLYINKTTIGGFANNHYWSSSEHAYAYAWEQDFANGIQTYLEYGRKDYPLFVRAIRTF